MWAWTGPLRHLTIILSLVNGPPSVPRFTDYQWIRYTCLVLLLLRRQDQSYFKSLVPTVTGRLQNTSQPVLQKMMLLSPTMASSLRIPLRTLIRPFNAARSRTMHRPPKVLAMAKEGSDAGNGVAEKIAIAGGLVSTPVIAWSLYTLKTTGCGLPPGPGGSIGALEGVSYLVVLGIIGWSVYTKAKTGSGLPNGPFGLLGAVEGLSYLSLLAILAVFGLQFLDKGFIPGPVPSDQCFG